MSNEFDFQLFENIILLVINDKKDVSYSFGSQVILINNKNSIPQILSCCNNSDLIILYSLDAFKIKLIKYLSNDLKIIWRFFGYELYYHHNSKYLSAKTKKCLEQISNSFIQTFINRNELRRIVYNHILKFRLKKALKKCDYFMGMMFDEYSILKKNWKYLPSFIETSFSSIENINFIHNIKKNHILIGNSRSKWNNHIDILEIVTHFPDFKEFQFFLPFNYGTDYTYSEYLEKKYSSFNSLNFIKNFLPLNEYKNIISHCKAAVFNNYRQLALANILYCLNFGVKVYLNLKNPTFNWLSNKGFIVFSIEEFAEDFLADNLELSNEEKDINFNLYKKYSSDESRKLFLDNILSLFNR